MPTPPPTSPIPQFRVGHGYDLHRLESGGTHPLLLAGIELPHEHRIVAHSDGDTLYHAVTDALLGALAQPDIGRLFPDNDPANDGRDSADFVRAAMGRVRDAGFAVANLDCTVILQRPRLAEARDAIRANLARLLEVEVAQVNVKGKSGEHLGPVGEARAVEVHAVVLLVRLPGPQT
ncbi:MAG: 2-C-methyl-D-erythritol 2,4-cyclodiphosphate synthase [Phycisphaerales bacterium]|nr:2-C-methyl-D-erythritol 2,4-cyclodiphosphate synthase [Phycisphaerales bacterium]